MFEFYQWDVTRSLTATQRLDAEMLGWGVMSRWAARYEFWKGTLMILRVMGDHHPGGAVSGPCFDANCEYCTHPKQREGNGESRKLKAMIFG